MLFSLHDEIGTCPNAEVCLMLHEEVVFFVHPFAIKKNQKPDIAKYLNHFEI